MKYLLPLAGLALLFTSAADAATPLRCKGRIIKTGVPASYVLSECGAPANLVVQESAARAATSAGASRIIGLNLSEQWIYERGAGTFPAVLIFLDGTLRRIEFLPTRS